MTPFLQYDLTEIEQSVAARFETQVERNPDRLAVRDAERALTYRQLNRLSNRLARAILARRSSASAEPIAVLVEHGASAVIAIIAILKAGKFYVPLDLTLPDARLDAILQDSEAPLILTNTANLARAQQLALDPLDLDTLPADLDDTNLALPISPDTYLNLMHTSGTTGEPKGVIQTQRNLLHAIVAADYPPHLPNEHVAQFTPFSFGGSAAMLFRTLFFASTIYPLALKQAGLLRLTPFLEENSITRFHTVPSVMRNWLALLPADKTFPLLRVVEVGGEPLFKRDLEKLFPHLSPTCIVRNALGTTETYIATWNFLDASTNLPDDVVSVGCPAPDMQVLVLDDTRQPVPLGETGEIYIKSRYLSPGYWRKPELTRATFIPVPAEPGLFLYKTGDVGRLRAEPGRDGAMNGAPCHPLEYLGRKDGVVKIRGHQVVLTFVETALRALDGIKDAALIAGSSNGDQRLIAYLVPTSQPPPGTVALRDALARTLPDYMIPVSFVLLEQLPYLPTGKLDRRSLPAVDNARPGLDTPFLAPRTPLEARLAQIWSEVLGIDRVGVRDAFIELGGNSLHAAQVVARASNATGVDIPLSAVFDVPTIEGLSQLITRLLAERVQEQQLEQMLREVEALADA